MSATVWITVAGLAVATALIKAFGPVIFGGRKLHPRLARIIPLLAPALLAALVVTETGCEVLTRTPRELFSVPVA